MVERKLYKTKLCLLYREGRCHRQSCSFAHGGAELRRFSASFNGRQDYRGSDLRDKLERRRSPLRRFSPGRDARRYSPGRDARGRYTSHGYSPSESHEKRGDKKRRKEQQLDGESDFSGSLKNSDGTAERIKNKRASSSDSKGVHEQLRQVQSDIDMLDDHKCQLEVYLEERAREEDNLSSQIHELEMQLFQEKEECKRITSKIKKFIKAHNHCSRIQDELKRSQARLQKLGDQLGSDAVRTVANEEDSNINSLSDDETIGNDVISPRNERRKDASPSKKRLQINAEAAEESKSASLTKGEGTIKSEKLSRRNALRAQSNNDKDGPVDNSGYESYRPLANEDKLKRGKHFSANGLSAVKLKGSESGLVLPPTGMAAHAGDEGIEMEEKFEAPKTVATGISKSSIYEISTESQFPLPPPPPLPPAHQTAFLKYADNDRDMFEEGLEEETVDVEIV